MASVSDLRPIGASFSRLGHYLINGLGVEFDYLVAETMVKGWNGRDLDWYGDAVSGE